MPTIRSTSADRSAICSFELTPCARMASLNCAPIDFTGLSAFIALCITTDRSFQRTAASCLSVSPTMLVPLKATPPPTMAAGGTRSWAMANSRVDLPQPDSPTMPMNSPGSRSKLTSSTARTVPRSMAYSTDRSRTLSTAPPVYLGAASPAGGLARTASPARLRGPTRLPIPLSLAPSSLVARPSLLSPDGTAPLRLVRSLPGALDTLPPHAPDRPQGRVADLVERVVEQREPGAEGDDAQAGHDDPQGLAGLERLVVLGPVQHRAPAGHARVAQPDELQAGGEQHGVERVGQEAGHQQRGHRGDDLDHDDVERALAADPRRLEEVAAAQRERLGPELPRRVRPSGKRDHRDHHAGACAMQIAADDDEQRKQRDDQQYVGDQAERAVPGAAQVGGRYADQRGDDRGPEPDPERDQQYRPGPVNHLREYVLLQRR